MPKDYFDYKAEGDEEEMRDGLIVDVKHRKLSVHGPELCL